MRKTGPAAVVAIAMDSISEALEAFAGALDMRSVPAESRADDLRAGAMRRDLGRRLALGNLDELRVVDRVLQRLEIGRERYGHLDLSKPRNWRKERLEDALNELVEQWVVRGKPGTNVRDAAQVETG